MMLSLTFTIMIQYIGEHSSIAFLGKLFISSAIATPLLAAIFYLFSHKNQNLRLKNIGRTFYILHFLSILAASFLLYVAIFGHYFEFAYVYKHSASYLPIKYLISAFWAGQEGSFLLWVFFQSILGLILLKTAKQWESLVMAIISIFQFLLATMVWGVRPFGVIVGQSPFTLLREQTANIGMEFFKNANYVSQITEGQGINPLLENYWMVIHPPILFIGYAAAIVPFAYAITALANKKYAEWLKPAFPWTVFSILSLGVGIILGGAWAYESLTFGGFWAWDPVENASLIPWLISLGALHMMILNRKQKHSYGMSFLLVILAFIMVLYASYLTRSGVLGETSAHAFGNNGLSAQMLLMMAFAFILSIVLYVINYKKFPKQKQEAFLSKEFWMYLGTILLLLSAFQIAVATSLPVINKVFGSEIAPPLDRIGFFNSWQLPFGLLIMATLAISLVLKFGKNNALAFFKSMLWPLSIGLLLFVFEVWVFQIASFQMLLFLFFTTLAMTSSGFYLFKNRLNILSLANVVSHFGISVFLTGVIVAFSQSTTISKNTSRFDFGDQLSNNENQLLNKGEMTDMGEYKAVYSGKERQDKRMYYFIDFYKTNEKGTQEKQFTVAPSVNANSMMGNVYDPDTRHQTNKDVYTYITFADLMSDYMSKDYETKVENEFGIKDTLWKEEEIIVLDTIVLKIDALNPTSLENVRIDAVINVKDTNSNSELCTTTYEVKNGGLQTTSSVSKNGKFRFSFVSLSSNSRKIKVKVEKKKQEFIVVKAIVFPWIALVWVGALITFIGLIISLFRNIKLSLKF